MKKSLCVYGLGLFIHWGMQLAYLELGEPNPEAQEYANRAKQEWEDHQKICPVCKPLSLN